MYTFLTQIIDILRKISLWDHSVKYQQGKIIVTNYHSPLNLDIYRALKSIAIPNDIHGVIGNKLMDVFSDNIC